MIRDNIKDFTVAAFRLYGHRDTAAPADSKIIKAVETTLAHLDTNGERETVNVVCRVYVALPLGRLCKGEISARVARVATDMYMSERNAWRRLARARKLFEQYYDEH